MTTLALKAAPVLTPATATARVSARRRARRVFTWELAGVLLLMGSCAAYVVFALSHLA